MFYKVRELKNEMADRINLKRYAVYLKDVTLGSVVIELAFPPSIAEGCGSVTGGCRDYREKVFVPQLVM